MTLLLSRTQPERVSCTATVLQSGTDEKGHYFITAETVFYPQGGGQMSDVGSVMHNGHSFAVKQVLMIAGEARHYLADVTGELEQGAEVRLEIDTAFRQRASIAHTAGHLISHVVETLMPSLIPAKGHHFLPGSYVEFSGNSTLSAEQLLEQVREKVQQAIDDNLPVSTGTLSFEVIARLRPELACAIPQNEEIRTVTIGDYLPFACGGTHAASTGALQGLELRKIKVKERMKISYEIA